MKKLKKILKITLIVLVCLIGLLFASGFIFKGKIVSLVKAEINKNINAKVDFKDVDISFLRHFPRVSLGLDELQVTGTGYFAADTLLAAKRLDVAIDIMSFFRGSDMNVYSLVLDAPRIHALVNKEGLANWDIVKKSESPADSTSESKPFHLELKKYEIKKGYVFYDDRQSDMSAKIINLDHSGSGDFNANLFTLATTTHADEVTYMYGGIPFLYRVNTHVDADIKIDNTNSVYSFDNLAILINDLKINGKGAIKSLANGYDMDISFKSPDSDFKNILSLVPAVYKNDFNKVTAKGTANFEGMVKGVYSDSTMPGYHIAMEIKDGLFKYTDLPKDIEKINLKVVVDNPDGQTDNTIVDITNGHLQIDNEPFDFRLLVRKPVSTMFVDAAAKGKLDLSQVSSFAKLEKGTTLAGLLNADVSIKGNVKDLEKEQYQNFYASGTIGLNRFNYTSADYPTGIKINTLNTRFTPSKIDVADLSGEYLKSNFTGNGQVNNLLNYLFSGKPLSANLTLNADKINLDDWMGVETDTTSPSPASAPFVVPANLDVVLNTKVDQLHYDKIDISNLTGSLKVEDQAVKLTNVHGNALDGDITINGTYSTKENKAKPTIAMSYAVDKADIQKTFYAFNSVQKLMPVGKFLAGKLTSSLSANGKLGEGMNIDMSTLSGNGNVLLIEGFLSKFAPLDKIASTLNVTQLQQISLKDVKTYFEFSNGKLLVKPFTVKVKDIEMEIGGLQGFDQSLDYTINLKLPRALMGTQGNQLVNSLASAANAKGIPLNVGETVNLKLAMGGTIKSPSIKVDLKQSGETLSTEMKDQVKEFAQAKIDSAKSVAKDTLNSIKKQLGDAAKEELSKQLFGKKDSTAADSTPAPKNATEKTKESLKGLLNNLKKKKDTTK
ncbi:MAG: AsmA-like C-terminal region-containing protein [Bacteroidota bacterium]|nr:AsmA-like C-terminal region-containing protein [Bacteroidota bacterium]